MSTLSDAELYTLCKKYGENARAWLRKFAGLLPEVLHRNLHRRRGFGSIHEFASRLAGMSHESVDRILRLHNRLSDKPHLRTQLESGSQAWTKIEKVSYIATAETEKQWAEKVENMTHADLEIFVNEVRNSASKSVRTNAAENISETAQQIFDNNESVTPQLDSWPHFSFTISPENQQQLLVIKNALEKEKKMTLTWNEVIGALLLKHGATAKTESPATVVQLCPDCVQRRQQEKEQKIVQAGKPVSRHIPREVRQLVMAQAKNTCSFQNCKKPADNIHHTQRFSLTRTHDPYSLVALCKTHHSFVHTGLIDNEESDPRGWRIAKQRVDMKVQSFKSGP
jgi:hypothetical protein